jgi:hypothetical protein
MSFVQSREKSASLSAVTFNELLADHLKRLVGDDSAKLRGTREAFIDGKKVDVPVVLTRVHGAIVQTSQDEIRFMEDAAIKLISQIRKTDPRVFASAETLQESKDFDRRPKG